MRYINVEKMFSQTVHIIGRAKVTKKREEKWKAKTQATKKWKMHSANKKWLENQMAFAVLITWPLLSIMLSIAQPKIKPAFFTKILHTTNIWTLCPLVSLNLGLWSCITHWAVFKDGSRISGLTARSCSCRSKKKKLLTVICVHY